MLIELLKDETIKPIIIALIGILGVLVGSFLNVLIYRIPKKEEFVKTPSHCLTCNHKLAWYDNIPLVSWITLGAKCRYCKTKLSAQYPIVEFLNGAIWVGVMIINGLNVNSILLALLASGLLVMSVIDWRTYEIADGFHIFFGAIGIVSTIIDKTNWLDHVIGMFCVSLILLIIYLVSGGRAIGGGDVKLMASCGLILGWQNITLALAIGCVVGSIIHIMRMKLSGADKVLAMGPYLAIGIMIAALFGNKMILWYLSLLNI